MDRKTRRDLIEKLRADADRICSRFGLEYASIEPERANVKRRYGICYSDGSIKIRLRHVYTGEPLKYSGLVNTLCHELAHLRHFDHSPRFQAFYLELLGFARSEGIYQPRSKTAPRPPRAETPKAGVGLPGEAQQLTLF
jgi:predicted metal-dependent hydrolase